MKKAIGIDIGGTGIKGALVNVKKGNLLSDRLRFDTPEGASPKAVIGKVVEIVNQLDPSGKYPIGICFPAIVKSGVTLSAANVSKEWIGYDAKSHFSKALGREVVLLNDADAAGVAEMKYGVGAKEKGLVIMTTLGTGIGTALFYSGKLIPNSELGHLEIEGVDYETKASVSAKERDGLSVEQWVERLNKYYDQLDRLLSPDLVIVGGGISKQSEDFLPMIKSKVRIIPAQTRNNAGIIGAALLAAKQAKED